MRDFEFKNRLTRLMIPKIVSQLTTIHEFMAEQTLATKVRADELKKMVEIARIQSTEASNKIEGIYTSDERLKKIVLDKTIPRNRDEQEIAGYRDVLNTIHENYNYIDLKPSIILQLHRDLYKFQGVGAGGKYKVADNTIEEIDSKGNSKIRFKPVPAWETPEAIDRLCEVYNKTIQDESIDPLLLIPMFILDFLCIHPFNDGNGRMSRLLTLLLLYKNDYTVGKYISIEKMIESSKETYYEALQASSVKWHEGKNNYEPFVSYMLGIIIATYREFSSRVKLLTQVGLNKNGRVGEIIKATTGTITKAEIMTKCPEISQITVQRALIELQNNGSIKKIDGGRYTKYIWNRDKEN